GPSRRRTDVGRAPSRHASGGAAAPRAGAARHPAARARRLQRVGGRQTDRGRPPLEGRRPYCPRDAGRPGENAGRRLRRLPLEAHRRAHLPGRSGYTAFFILIEPFTVSRCISRPPRPSVPFTFRPVNLPFTVSG